jgi:hypothetical protein
MNAKSTLVCNQKASNPQEIEEENIDFCLLWIVSQPSQIQFFTPFQSLGFRVYQTLNHDLSTIHTFSIHGINLFELQHTFKTGLNKMHKMECGLCLIHKVLSFCKPTQPGFVATDLAKAHCRNSISRSPITHEEKLRHLLELE